MGRTTVFNGQLLTIPDAYSALDLSRLLTPTSGGVGIVALVGEAEGGKPGITVFPGGTSPAIVKSELKKGPLANMCRMALRSGVDRLVQGGASTVIAFKTNNSTRSEVQFGGLQTALQEIYTVLFSNVGSFYDVVGAAKKFNLAGGLGYVWLRVTDGANVQTDPTGTGTAYQLDVLAADTAAQIAAKAQALLNPVSGITVTVATATITVTHDVAAAVTPDAADVDAGVTVTTTQQGQAADSIGAIKILTKQYGLFTAQYTAEIASVLGQKILTVRDENGVPESSIGVGATIYMTIQYTGAGAVATAELKYVAGLLRLLLIVDSVTVADIDVSALTLLQVKNSLMSVAGFTVTVPQVFEQIKATDLDLTLTATNVKAPAKLDVKASIYELVKWSQEQSVLVDVERGSENNGDTVPGTIATTAMTGGTRGTTSNSAVQDALNALLDFRMNILVPLFSSDNQDGSTISIAAVNAQVKDHVVSRSAILGRSECQAYVSVKGNKQAFIDMIDAMNSRWVSVVSQEIQDLDIEGNVVWHPEYAKAVVDAQTQAGSPIGTDLTYRALPVLGIRQNVSWSPTRDGAEIIQKGGLIAGPDEENTIRIIAGYTSWKQDSNNANIYIETVESLAIFAFNHRKFMKERFLGVSAFTRQDIVDAITQSLETERDTTKSIKGFDLTLTKIISATAGELRYELAVVPFEGIKFILPTVVAIREA